MEVLLLIFSAHSPNLSCRTSKPALTYIIGPYVDHNHWVPPYSALLFLSAPTWAPGGQHTVQDSFSRVQTMLTTPLIIESPTIATPFSWRMWPSGCPVAHQSSCSQGRGPIPAMAGIGWTPPRLEMLPLCSVHSLSFACTYCELLSPNCLVLPGLKVPPS